MSQSKVVNPALGISKFIQALNKIFFFGGVIGAVLSSLIEYCLVNIVAKYKGVEPYINEDDQEMQAIEINKQEKTKRIVNTLIVIVFIVILVYWLANNVINNQ